MRIWTVFTNDLACCHVERIFFFPFAHKAIRAKRPLNIESGTQRNPFSAKQMITAQLDGKKATRYQIKRRIRSSSSRFED